MEGSMFDSRVAGLVDRRHCNLTRVLGCVLEGLLRGSWRVRHVWRVTSTQNESGKREES